MGLRVSCRCSLHIGASALICLGGILLAAVLALLISGRITRSLRRLARSAEAVRSCEGSRMVMIA